MNIVNAVAPIAIEDLKKYFTDKTTFYIIDYRNSALKDMKLITYLSNLDIPCDIKFEGAEDALELLQHYFTSTTLVNIPALEHIATDVLLTHKGIFTNPVYDSFIENNLDIIEAWSERLDSLALYNMFIVDSPEFKEFVNEFATDESQDVVGINFVSLLKHSSFYQFYQKLDRSKLKNFKHYFNDYMFKGKSMYSFWCNSNNPLFLLTYGIAENKFKPSEYTDAEIVSVKELSSVTPI